MSIFFKNIIIFCQISILSVFILPAFGQIIPSNKNELNQNILDDFPYLDLEMLSADSDQNQAPQKEEFSLNNIYDIETPVVPIKIIAKKAPVIIKPVVWLELFNDIVINSNRMKVNNLMNVNSTNNEIITKIKNFDLGLSPKANDKTVLTTKLLLDKLKLGFPLYDFRISNPNDINISRQTEIFSIEDQKRLITEFEKTQFNTESFNIEYFTQLKPIILEGENWHASVNQLTTNKNFKNWKITFKNEKQVPKNTIIRGRVSVNNTVKIQQEAIIKNNPDTNIPSSPLLTQTVVKKLDATPLVKKGNLLNLNYETTLLSINTKATALEYGNIGDFIQVRNNNTNKILTVKITGPNIVSINN